MSDWTKLPKCDWCYSPTEKEDLKSIRIFAGSMRKKEYVYGRKTKRVCKECRDSLKNHYTLTRHGN